MDWFGSAETNDALKKEAAETGEMVVLNEYFSDCYLTEQQKTMLPVLEDRTLYLHNNKAKRMQVLLNHWDGSW